MIRKETLSILEFDKILERVSAHSLSEASRRAVLGIRPLGKMDEIEARFGAVTDIRRLAQDGTPLKLSRFHDITNVIREARPEGAVLEPVALVSVGSALRVMDAVTGQLSEREDLRFLHDLTVELTGFPELMGVIERTVDFEGNVLDEASFELHDLRARIRALEKKITKRLEGLTRSADLTPFLQDDFITKRSGRWVIPVRMDAKGQVPGVVHDVSRSGETAFVEPLEIIGLANEMENLLADEKAEVFRILRSISASIRGVADDLEVQFETLVRLGMLHSIAVFSDRMRMNVPVIAETPELRLVGARHPLLMMLQKKDVVPLDLALGKEDSVMVITGPNAGGKTIAIKTAGLLALMALSGMPVPADSSSVIPLVDDVLVDIGDEQSIETSLSTFSAHVSNIAAIINRAGLRALALIDELGTGTDPVQGAAIGCAVLRELKDKGALVLATTHLTDIVTYVHREEGMVNASMDFDIETLTPLYRLKAGEPGQSHALETAERFGLPLSTVALAKKMLGTAEVEFHALMADLKRQRQRHEEALEELEKKKAEMDAERARLAERVKALEAERSQAMEAANREARDIVSNAIREVHDILDEAKKEKSRAALRKLQKKKAEMDEKLKAYDKEPSLDIEEISEGGVVFVKSAGADAEVVGVDRKRKRVRVKLKGMDVEVPVSEVARQKGKPKAEAASVISDAGEPVSSRISLVGLRVDDALARLEPFLNHASLAGLREVVIVHGIGTGALRRAVREHLDGHPLIAGFRAGEQPEGGDGVTVATLR